MKDIDLAKELLIKEKLAIVIVKNGEIIFSSSGSGIKPMYTAVNEIKDSLKGSSIADKVIGKAAAMLCEYAGIKELYTNLISENAIKILEKTEIIYEYEESSSYIRNRDNTGMCPVEAMSLSAQNVDVLLNDISDFLKRINNA